MANRCNAIARINRVGNGFNHQNENGRCTAEATTVAEYKILDAGSWAKIGTEILPTCDKHAAATPAMAYRRELKRVQAVAR